MYIQIQVLFPHHDPVPASVPHILSDLNAQQNTETESPAGAPRHLLPREVITGHGRGRWRKT